MNFYYVAGEGYDHKHVQAIVNKYGRESIIRTHNFGPFEWGLDISIEGGSAVELKSLLKPCDDKYGRFTVVTELDAERVVKQITNEKFLKTLQVAVNDARKGIERGIDEQIEKYGIQRISALAWIAVIAEEFGEMVAEYNKQNIEEFEKEAMQTIACVTRLIHEVRREHNGTAEEERDMYVRHS